MDNKTKTKQQNTKVFNKINPLETLRNLGSGALGDARRDLLERMPKDMFNQFFGLPEKRISGNITPGEMVSMDEILSGERENNQKLKQKLFNERQMRAEEQKINSGKQQELRMQLSALTSEVSQLAQTTQGLSHEVEVAAMSAPVTPGVYHIVFLEKLREFIRSFRLKIDNASTWIASSNSRARKRAHTFWGQVGVGGAKRLLSAEDYLQRSAG